MYCRDLLLETEDGPLGGCLLDATPPWHTDPATILFHHGVGTTSGIWQNWFPVLAPRFRLLTFDVRGHGRSPGAPKDGTWRLENLLRDVLALADAVAADQFHLVGESAGGTLALYGGLESERVVSVTGVSCSHRGGSIQRVQSWDAAIKANGVKSWSDDMMEQRFYPNAVAAPALQWFAETQDNTAAESILGMATMLIGTDLSDRLSNLTKPVLLLSPDASPFVPLSVTSDLAARLPQGRLQVFPHARHGLAFTHGRQCAEALNAFVTAIDS